jgi:hypothetical protein
LYLAGNTIDLGGVTITTAANGNMILSGNLSVAGSVNPSVPLYGNTDVAGYLSTYTGNVAAGNIIVGANVVTTGIKSAAYYFSNGTPFASSSFGNADVATYLPTYTGNIAAGNISVGNVTVGNITVNGWTTSRQTSEVLTALTGATGTVTHDLSTASTFYHTSLSANFTANFTNVPTVNNRIITSTIIMVQGVTPYVPTAVQIDGAAQTIKWNMNAPFAGTASKTDIVSFSLIRVAGAWTVIGSSTYFG